MPTGSYGIEFDNRLWLRLDRGRRGDGGARLRRWRVGLRMQAQGAARRGRGFIRFERRQGIFGRMRRAGVNAMGRIGFRQLRLRTGGAVIRRAWRRIVRVRAGRGGVALGPEAAKRIAAHRVGGHVPASERSHVARVDAGRRLDRRREGKLLASRLLRRRQRQGGRERRGDAVLYCSGRHVIPRADAQAAPSGVAPRTSVKDLWLTSAYRGAHSMPSAER